MYYLVYVYTIKQCNTDIKYKNIYIKNHIIEHYIMPKNIL